MSKKLTIEEVREFIKRNSSCTLLSTEYVNAHIKLRMQCKCTKEFEISFDKFKQGKRQCNECSNHINWNIKKIKQFVKENSKCELLSTEYINALNNLDFKCECGNIFQTPLASFINGKIQCNECSFEIRNNKRRKPQIEFINEMFKKYDNEYTVLGEYISAKIPILIRHNKCGNKWSTTPSSIRQKAMCPFCSHNKKRDTDQFKKEVYGLVGDEYSVLGDYINAVTKISMRHNTCNNEFDITPSKFINCNHRCSVCNGGVVKTHEQFVKEVYASVGNEFTVLGEYKNHHTNILMKHNKCGHEYNVRPNDFVNNGNRCPFCNESRGEKKMSKWLGQNGFEYIPQYRFDGCIYKRRLPFDIYLPLLNTCIEYDGEQHFKVARYSNDKDKMIRKLKDIQLRDKIKTDFCKNNNIKLIRISYIEFDSIETILESVLK